MSLTVKSVVDAGNDALVVTAVDENGNEFNVVGVVSATTAFFDPADVDNDRLPKAGAKTRAMKPEEVGAYAQALVEGRDYFAELYVQVAPEPIPVEFVVSD